MRHGLVVRVQGQVLVQGVGEVRVQEGEGEEERDAAVPGCPRPGPTRAAGLLEQAQAAQTTLLASLAQLCRGAQRELRHHEGVRLEQRLDLQRLDHRREDDRAPGPAVVRVVHARAAVGVEAQPEDHHAVHQRLHDPLEDLGRAEVAVAAAAAVQPRVLQRVLARHVSVEHARHDDRQAQEQVEARDQHVLVRRAAAVAALRRVGEQRDHQHHVLVERVQDDLGLAPVRPAPVHHEQRLQELELRDGKVRRVHRLLALPPADADADLRLPQHRDVVGTVADGQRHRQRPDALLHRAHQQGLLLRRHAARDHRHALVQDAEQRQLQRGVVQHVQQRGTFQDDGQVLPRRQRSTGRGLRFCRACFLRQRLDLLEALLDDRRAALLFREVKAALGSCGALSVFREPAGHDRIIQCLDLRVDLVWSAVPQDLDVHLRAQHPGAQADVLGRLALVSREDPQLDPRGRQRRDGLRHLVLQPVLDGRGAGQEDVLLDVQSGVLQRLASALDGLGGLVKLHEPALELGFRHKAVAQHERTEALLGEAHEVILDGSDMVQRGVRADVEHLIVGALHEEEYAPTQLIRLANQDAHALAVGVELVHGKQQPLLGACALAACRVSSGRLRTFLTFWRRGSFRPSAAELVSQIQRDRHLRALAKLETQLARGADQSTLVGTLRLVGIAELLDVGRGVFGADGGQAAAAPVDGAREVIVFAVALGALLHHDGVAEAHDAQDLQREERGVLVPVQMDGLGNLDLAAELAQVALYGQALQHLTRAHLHPRRRRRLLPPTLGLGGGVAEGGLPQLLAGERAVDHAGDGAELEAHDVLREGAGLVAEDVLDHAEVGDVVAARPGRRVGLLGVHAEVVVHEAYLDEGHDLDGDVHAERDEVVEQHDEGEPAADEGARLVLPLHVGVLGVDVVAVAGIAARFVPVAQVVQPAEVPLLKVDEEDRGHRDQHQVHEEDHFDGVVDRLVHAAQLHRWVRGVLRQLGVAPGVHRAADGPAGVPQHRAAQHDVLHIERQTDAAILPEAQRAGGLVGADR
eukprot:scaffold139_cov246-Pinguiococcus_pyrenoidosus.AAC.6